MYLYAIGGAKIEPKKPLSQMFDSRHPAVLRVELHLTFSVFIMFCAVRVHAPACLSSYLYLHMLWTFCLSVHRTGEVCVKKQNVMQSYKEQEEGGDGRERDGTTWGRRAKMDGEMSRGEVTKRASKMKWWEVDTWGQVFTFHTGLQWLYCTNISKSRLSCV